MPKTPSANAPPGNLALEGLVTHEQTELLSFVNQLKNLGVSKWIDLPQIVVVGAQSSGKSSVLEAISRIPFPQGDTLCTTYASEVTLLRDEATSVKLRLRPGPKADQGRRTWLQEFDMQCANVNEVADAVAKAKTHLYGKELAAGGSKDSFLEDILCLEYSHPAFPPLTLVDLPGLINIPNEGQTRYDVQVVRDMVKKYMLNPKTIILAIVSAASDMSEHLILDLAKEVDPKGQRTLGIITKPDTLPDGSASQSNFLRLASNENHQWHLDLGWHVVRNRKYEERDTDLDERDQTERQWFNDSIWENTLGRQCIGVDSLRYRLAALLEQQTRRYLPGVISEIRSQLDRCNSGLDRLGPARGSPQEQRSYLVATSEKFKSLVHLSLEGLYRDPFFATNATRRYRLRARVQELNQAFATTMQHRGHSLAAQASSVMTIPNIPTAYHVAAGTWGFGNRAGYLQLIEETMKQCSGRDLPGLFPPDVIREVFIKKASKWQAIAEAHLEEVWKAVNEVLLAMAAQCASPYTSQRIMRHIVSKSMEQKRVSMHKQLEGLMAAHLKCHPMTYDPEFIQRVPYAGYDAKDDDSKKPQAKGEVEYALSYVEAYYQIARCRFVDNVATLCVEMCLLDGLESIFAPTLVSQMANEELDLIAGESIVIIQQRAHLLEKQERLKQALSECIANGSTSVDETVPQITVSDSHVQPFSASPISQATVAPTPSRPSSRTSNKSERDSSFTGAAMLGQKLVSSTSSPTPFDFVPVSPRFWPQNPFETSSSQGTGTSQDTDSPPPFSLPSSASAAVANLGQQHSSSDALDSSPGSSASGSTAPSSIFNYVTPVHSAKRVALAPA